MKRILENRIVRIWSVRLLIAFIVSHFTETGVIYCLAGYFVVLFLFDFAVKLLLPLTGIVIMVVLALTVFIGLLTIA